MSMARSRVAGVKAVIGALVVGVIFAPGTAAAGEKTSTGARSPLRASVEQVALKESHRLTRQAAAAPLKDAAQQSQTPSPDPSLESGSFFRSKAGVAVLIAFGAGLGYALYSSSNDRIRSSGR